MTAPPLSAIWQRLVYDLLRSPVKCFKEALDRFGIQGIELAEVTGRSKQNISAIRCGKVAPSIKDFCDLLLAAESMKSGVLEDFSQRLSLRFGTALIEIREKIDLEILVDSMSSEELAVFMNLLSARFLKNMSAKQKESEKEYLLAG
jgi:transcriptional regulator with XRE-family HTH domain